MNKEIKDLQITVNRLYRRLKSQAIKPMTIDEACKYLGLSKSFLYKLTSANKITHFKPDGKKIYFKRRDLNKYAFRNKANSVDDLVKGASIKKGKH